MSAVPLLAVQPKGPEVVFSRQNLDNVPKTAELTCVICQETLQNTAENPVIGHGSGTAPHLFHQNCIAGALAERVACPTCRAPVINAADFANPQVIKDSAQVAIAQGAEEVAEEIDGIDPEEGIWDRARANAGQVLAQRQTIGHLERARARRTLVQIGLFVCGTLGVIALCTGAYHLSKSL
jgi:hypothetical protein